VQAVCKEKNIRVSYRVVGLKMIFRQFSLILRGQNSSGENPSDVQNTSSGSLPWASQVSRSTGLKSAVQACGQAVLYDGDPRAGVRVGVFFPEVPAEIRSVDAMSISVERVKGIEPSSKAWEAAVLPLNYTRIPC